MCSFLISCFKVNDFLSLSSSDSELESEDIYKEKIQKNYFCELSTERL